MSPVNQHLRTIVNALLCALTLSAYYLLGQWLESVLSLPITGALYGMALLLATLFLFRPFAQWMTQAVQPLLMHMVFFFIPAVMNVTLFADTIQRHAWALFLAVFVSTLVSLGMCAALTQRFLGKKLRDEVSQHD